MVSNMYIVVFCLCGFLIVIFGILFVVVFSIRYYWLFGDGMCKFYGFFLMGLGIVMIVLMIGIVIDKYIYIVWFQVYCKVMKSFVLGIIILCYVYGVIWGILFLFGWNKYIFEFVRFICFVEWIGDFLNYFYVIIILFIGFLILVGVIVSLYLLILKKVS